MALSTAAYTASVLQAEPRLGQSVMSVCQNCTLRVICPLMMTTPHWLIYGSGGMVFPDTTHLTTLPAREQLRDVHQDQH